MTELEKLQYKIDQLELSLSGGMNALEFKFAKILQSNLDILWLLICAILVFFNASWIHVFGIRFGKKEK